MNANLWKLILLVGPLAFAACEDVPGLPVPDPFVDSTVVAAPAATRAVAYVAPHPNAGTVAATEICDPVVILGGLALISSR